MNFRIEQLEAQPVAGIRTPVRISEIGQRIGELVPEMETALGDRIAGPLLARYHTWKDGAGEMEVAFPVREPIEPTGRVRPGELPAGPAVIAEHVGPYEGLKAAWAEVQQWTRAEGLQHREPAWEWYIDDCNTTPPETLVTWIVCPIAPPDRSGA